MSIQPIFGFGQKGKSATVSAQRHLNLYAEYTASINPVASREQEKSQMAFYGTPGLLLKTSFGDTPARGWIAVNDIYYVLHRGTFYSVDNVGTKTALGTVTTTVGKADMAYNGVLILITTGTNGYTYTIGTNTFGIIADADFPQTANTCTWLDGQFIVDNGIDDVFQTSPDGLAWDPLDFAAAESNPDGLVRVFVDNGEVILGGAQTTEYWGDVGGADFSFAAIKGATTEYGLAARWTMCKYNSGVAALMKNRAGQVQVMWIAGYTPKVISSQEMDFIINSYTTVSDATAYAYMLGGHPMLQINFPSAGTSWLFDASTNMWSPLEYGLSGGRHRGEMHLDFINKPLISDYSTGDIYQLDANTYTDNGMAIARELIGKHFFDENKRVIVDELYVDMATGVGLVSGQGSNPIAMLQISKDNGRTWGNELWVSMGKMGKYLTRVIWRRLGVARDWVFKFRITDPVKVVITFAAIRARE